MNNTLTEGIDYYVNRTPKTWAARAKDGWVLCIVSIEGNVITSAHDQTEFGRRVCSKVVSDLSAKLNET